MEPTPRFAFLCLLRSLRTSSFTLFPSPDRANRVAVKCRGKAPRNREAVEGVASAASGVAQRPNPEVPSPGKVRSEEHTSELQSLLRISYAVFCLKKKIHIEQ